MWVIEDPPDGPLFTNACHWSCLLVKSMKALWFVSRNAGRVEAATCCLVSFIMLSQLPSM